MRLYNIWGLVTFLVLLFAMSSCVFFCRKQSHEYFKYIKKSEVIWEKISEEDRAFIQSLEDGDASIFYRRAIEIWDEELFDMAEEHLPSFDKNILLATNRFHCRNTDNFLVANSHFFSIVADNYYLSHIERNDIKTSRRILVIAHHLKQLRNDETYHYVAPWEYNVLIIYFECLSTKIDEDVLLSMGYTPKEVKKICTI
jgi:hypothetical protein